MLIVLCFVFLAACSTPDYLPEQALHEYLGEESHGVSKSINSGDISMQMTFRPNDFLIWQELEDERDTARIAEVINNYSQYLYFVMQLSAGERDALYSTSVNQADFSDKLQTLSFRMPQFVNMTTSEHDTIPLTDAHYSRMFGMSKSSDVLLVFNAEQIQDDEWISINSKEFGFKTGRRSFRFRLKDLKNTPKLSQLKPYYELIEKN